MKLRPLNKRLESIEPSKLKVNSRTDPDVLSLSVGEPDFETPWGISQAGIDAINHGDTFYADDRGLPELRHEIGLYLKRHYELDYKEKDEILVTVGASEAIDLSLRALLNEGDEVLVPSPGYISYAPLARLMGASVVSVPLREERKFRLSESDLEKAITDRSKLLFLNYPHNPTGATMGKEDLEKIARVAIRHNLYVLSDEIYAELTYAGKHVSIASLSGMKERTIVVSGFSKAFAMTGWRLGYAASSNNLIEHLLKIHQFSMLAAPTISQYAALEALKKEEGETLRMKEAYDERRKYLVGALNDIGLTTFAPEGAFYVFPSIRASGLSSDEFVSRLYEEEKLIVVPGTGFGKEGEGYIRISYAYSLKELKEGVRRLHHFLVGLRK